MEENKIIKLFTGEKVQTNGREFTKLLGGFGEDKPMFTVWQSSELLGKATREIIQNYNNNKSVFTYDIDVIDLKNYMNKNEIENILKNIGFHQNKLNATGQWLCFSLKGLLKLIEITDICFKNNNFLKEYFELDELPNLKIIRHETNFKEIIQAMLSDYVTIKYQFPIYKYKVDFFIPEMLLIIEYDEGHHKYNKKEDKIREENIKNEFYKWESIFLDEDEVCNKDSLVTILRIKKGYEYEGIKNIMNQIAHHGANIILPSRKLLYKNVNNLYDYYNSVYDLTHFMDKVNKLI